MLNHVDIMIVWCYFVFMAIQQSKRSAKEKITTTSLRLPEKKLLEIKMIALKEQKSMNVLVEEIITSYLDSHKKK